MAVESASLATDKQKTGFMDLARELRDLIYEESDSVIRILEKDPRFSEEAIVELHGMPSPNLKLVSHQVNEEYQEALIRTAKPPRLVVSFFPTSSHHQAWYAYVRAYVGTLARDRTLPPLPSAVRNKLADIEQVDVVYHRCSDGGDVEYSLRNLPSLRTLRRVHHRDHAGQLTIVKGIPTLRFPADDEALKTTPPDGYRDYSTFPSTYKPYAIENVLIVHDKLYSMWDKAANLSFVERSRYEGHLRNSMRYTIKRVGTPFTVQRAGHFGPHSVQYVDVELEPAPAFAGSFEEVEAEMLKK